MKRLLLSILLCGTVTATQTFGRSIGVNFVSDRRAESALGAAEEAGFVAQVNWNNSIPITADNAGTGNAASGDISMIATPTEGVLVDDTGAATDVYISWESSNTYSQDTGTAPATPDQKLMDGYLDAALLTGDVAYPTEIYLDSIPYELYDLIIYVGSDGNDRVGKTTLDYDPATDIFYMTASNWISGAFSGAFVRAVGTTQETANAAHYSIYKNLTASSVVIENTRVTNNVGLHGIQIVEILDNDNDGMLDSWELKNGLDPSNPADANQDADNDGLTNLQEFNLNYDPNNPDMDDDGLLDGREVELGSDPYVQDTDRDGLLDGEEDAMGLDPTTQDSDGDGYTEPFEIANGSDPTNVNSVPEGLDAAISVNFIGGRSNIVDEIETGVDGGIVTGVAGVEERPNWNNVASVGVVEGGPTALVDDSGADSGATIEWSGVPNTWSITTQTPPDGNSKLMNGYLDTLDDSTTTAMVSNVSFDLYDVIVYFERDNTNSLGRYTVNDRVHHTLVPDPVWPVTGGNGVFMEANLPNEIGNYTVFSNMTGDDITILAFPLTHRAPLNGIQIIDAPDTDGDGISDRLELKYGLNPNDASDAAGDLDSDGLTNLQEAQLGLLLDVADWDQDGLLDGDEVAFGSDPWTPDADGDGLLDGDEFAVGSDPRNQDTDGDGYTDDYEFMVKTDPTDVNITPAGIVGMIGINLIAGHNGDPDGDGVEQPVPGGSVTGIAGYMQQANWNNVADVGVPAGGPVALIDDTGVASGASVTWSGSPNTWSITTGAPADQHGQLMNGYLDTNNTSTTTVVVENVSFPTYNVIVYMDGDGTNNIGSYTVNGVNKMIRDQNNNWPVTAGGRTYRLSEGTSDAGNYAIWEGVTGATLTITATPAEGGTRAPMNGIQIFEPIPTSGEAPVITGIAKASATELTITFASVAGASYTLQAADNPAGPFTDLQTGVAATGDSTAVTVGVAEAAKFFRLVLE